MYNENTAENEHENHIGDNVKKQLMVKILTKANTLSGKLAKANTIYGSPCCPALSWPAVKNRTQLHSLSENGSN